MSGPRAKPGVGAGCHLSNRSPNCKLHQSQGVGREDQPGPETAAYTSWTLPDPSGPSPRGDTPLGRQAQMRPPLHRLGPVEPGLRADRWSQGHTHWGRSYSWPAHQSDSSHFSFVTVGLWDTSLRGLNSTHQVPTMTSNMSACQCLVADGGAQKWASVCEPFAPDPGPHIPSYSLPRG